jgi:uncharacterized membrane protein YkoI
LALALTLTLVFAPGLALLPGRAGADDDHERARHLQESGEIVALEVIIWKLKARGMTRLLEVELEEKRGRYVYEIEMLDDRGVVQKLWFDARSGELLGEKREDD